MARNQNPTAVQAQEIRGIGFSFAENPTEGVARLDAFLTANPTVRVDVDQLPRGNIPYKVATSTAPGSERVLERLVNETPLLAFSPAKGFALRDIHVKMQSLRRAGGDVSGFQRKLELLGKGKEKNLSTVQTLFGDPRERGREWQKLPPNLAPAIGEFLTGVQGTLAEQRAALGMAPRRAGRKTKKQRRKGRKTRRS